MNSQPIFRIVPFTEQYAVEVCSWCYDPPYDLYNWDSWDNLVTRQEEFADPAVREAQYAAVLDENDELCGFAQFFPIVGVTRLGFGMRPDRCGRGDGPTFVRAIVEEAKRRMPTDEIDLEVLTWNHRARKAYESAGFQITDTYVRPTPEGTGEFHCMVYLNTHDRSKHHTSASQPHRSPSTH